MTEQYRVEAQIILTDGSKRNVIVSDIIELRDAADARSKMEAVLFENKINKGSICAQLDGNYGKWSVIPTRSIRSITVYVARIFEELYDD